jgi:hypothetical protein
MTKMSENSKTDVPDVGRLEWDHVIWAGTAWPATHCGKRLLRWESHERCARALQAMQRFLNKHGSFQPLI